jgi:hypothetical protein
LDASDKLSYYTLTPERIVNTRGLIIEGNGRWIDVIDNKHKYEVVVAIKGVIDDKGVMTGEGNINSINYARRERMEKYSADPDGFKQTYFIKSNPSLAIRDIIITNADQDSLPLLQKMVFTTPVSTSGEYTYFNTNFLSDFTSNPFIKATRRTDIDFGYQQEYAIYGQFTIPEGYTFETVPPNTTMSMPDRSIQYSRFTEVKNNVLNSRITIDFKRPYYLIADYELFHKFYKDLLASLNEQVVLKKKS